MKTEVKHILEQVSKGELSVDEALLQLKLAPYEDIGFAKVDLHRKVRQGVAEVIYGASKTPEQMIAILDVMTRARKPRRRSRKFIPSPITLTRR